MLYKLLDNCTILHTPLHNPTTLYKRAQNFTQLYILHKFYNTLPHFTTLYETITQLCKALHNSTNVYLNNTLQTYHTNFTNKSQTLHKSAQLCIHYFTQLYKQSTQPHKTLHNSTQLHKHLHNYTHLYKVL